MNKKLKMILGMGSVVVIGIILLLFFLILKKKKPVFILNQELHEVVEVGDYVNYDIGKWKETKEIPGRGQPFIFGGYKEGNKITDSLSCGYNPTEISGFRVFSIEKDSVTLISTGITECFYLGYGEDSPKKAFDLFKDKDFSVYLNKYGKSAHLLSKEEIDKFASSDTSYTRVENDLIVINNPYWLATSTNEFNLWYVTEGGIVATDRVGTYGIRIVVTLKQNVTTTGKNEQKIWQLTENVKREKSLG